MAETATSVGRPVDRDSNKKSRCRLSVDRPVGRNKQRANVLQSGMFRSAARSTVKHAHGYTLLPEPRSTGSVDRFDLT